MSKYYSIVKESNADLGVNFKIVQNRWLIIKNIVLFLEIFAIFHSQLSLARWYDRLDTASSFNSDQSHPSQHLTSSPSRGSLVGVRAFLEKNWEYRCQIHLWCFRTNILKIDAWKIKESTETYFLELTPYTLSSQLKAL